MVNKQNSDYLTGFYFKFGFFLVSSVLIFLGLRYRALSFLFVIGIILIILVILSIVLSYIFAPEKPKKAFSFNEDIVRGLNETTLTEMHKMGRIPHYIKEDYMKRDWDDIVDIP